METRALASPSCGSGKELSRIRQRTRREERRMSIPAIDVDALSAIDVHVHLEPVEDNTIDAAAKKYFGDSGAPRDRKGLADYYRSRKIAFVVFAVDERLTGKPRVSNHEVVQFARDNSDIAIPFASVDPKRGADGVQEAKRSEEHTSELQSL